jgi:hypothetical protein
VIVIDLDAGGLSRAFGQMSDSVESGVRRGLEATLESIAARARQTATFTDRTGALRNSIQSDGVTGSGLSIDGVVSFAATSERGYPYGLALEFGTSRGIRERRFIRDAIDQEDGDLIEDSLAASLRAIGFEVKRT